MFLFTGVFFTENLCYYNIQQAHCGADGGFHWVSDFLQSTMTYVITVAVDVGVG